MVLQIQKIRNVCVPKENEELSASGTGGQRLLKLVLTDGQQTLHALEVESLPALRFSSSFQYLFTLLPVFSLDCLGCSGVSNIFLYYPNQLAPHSEILSNEHILTT